MLLPSNKTLPSVMKNLFFISSKKHKASVLKYTYTIEKLMSLVQCIINVNSITLSYFHSLYIRKWVPFAIKKEGTTSRKLFYFLKLFEDEDKGKVREMQIGNVDRIEWIRYTHEEIREMKSIYLNKVSSNNISIVVIIFAFTDKYTC